MDIFDQFLKGDHKTSTHVRNEQWPKFKGTVGRAGFAPGTRINLIEVVGPHVIQGRFGKLTQRKYKVRCVAPTGENGAPCGKLGLASYHQIYYGTIYSCGCLPKPRHPPVRLEGQRIGQVEVLRWAPDHGGSWELVCHECGELLYRKSTLQVRAAGVSCAGHNKLFC